MLRRRFADVAILLVRMSLPPRRIAQLTGTLRVGIAARAFPSHARQIPRAGFAQSFRWRSRWRRGPAGWMRDHVGAAEIGAFEQQQRAQRGRNRT